MCFIKEALVLKMGEGHIRVKNATQSYFWFVDYSKVSVVKI